MTPPTPPASPAPPPAPAPLPRCAVLDDYQGAALSSADWSPLHGRVETRVLREHLTDRDALVAAVGDCEILVVMRERTPLDAALLDRLPRLRLVVTSGLRNASIDLAACRERGITVCGTASGSEPPAELTWALILGLVRHVTTEARAVREGGPWQSTVGGDLAGRTLGLLGLGKIGARVAAVGRAFGMDVLAWSPNLTEERVAAHGGGVRLAKDKAELFADSDVVSLHLVLSDRTRAIVGEPELRAMRPGAYLVNTSRAGLVDGTALLRALRERWFAGAGLDVYETEPLPAGDPLRTLPNVLALPHLGYVSEANYARYFGQAVEDVEAYLAGAPVRVLE
ncbi:D-2-hydroxyacid dehydrogenase family protein [Streptomyces sp. NPDC056049]|uniref:D-2-hydroxyacid dehydrogenase family protein n=1 Tax=Streptomyces sp. NPDC056049 TaxID=3345693 RepID=UPI0035DBDF91